MKFFTYKKVISGDFRYNKFDEKVARFSKEVSEHLRRISA